MSAAIYGFILYKKEPDSYNDKQLLLRLIIATVLVAIVVNMGLNTLWTSITTGKAFWALLVTRIVKQLIMIPIHVIVIFALEKALRKPFDKYVRSSND